MEKFTEELKFYEEHKAEYIKHYKDQFLVIKGNELFSNFPNEEEAYNAGVTKFGSEPFLIKKVVEKEEPEAIPALSLGIINAKL